MRARRGQGGKSGDAMSLHRPRAWLPFLLWALALAGWLWLVFSPASTRTTRGLSLLLLAIVYFGALTLGWRWKWARWGLLTLLVAGAIFLVLPGRDKTDLHALRSAYVQALLRYRGTAYVHGGESWKGVDSSGLVRRGLIESAFARGLRTLDPGLVRGALTLWWHDASARALVEWQRDIADHLFDAPSINTLDHRHLLPGDIAVTANGAHILAYLGDRTWIEANPQVGRIITVTVPDDGNAWFTQPIRLFRWRLLRR